MTGRLGGMHFAIADLDGDRQPDLAIVEPESQREAGNKYWIRLHFGGGMESAIAVNAPAGGLRLSARDVNGDDSIDLVVSTELDAKIIEVLINDGHGNFSVAEPGSYAASAKEGTVFLQPPLQASADLFSLAQSRSSFEGEDVTCHAHPATLPSASVSLFEVHAALVASRHVKPGRAPPASLTFA